MALYIITHVCCVLCTVRVYTKTILNSVLNAHLDLRYLFCVLSVFICLTQNILSPNSLDFICFFGITSINNAFAYLCIFFVRRITMKITSHIYLLTIWFITIWILFQSVLMYWQQRVCSCNNNKHNNSMIHLNILYIFDNEKNEFNNKPHTHIQYTPCKCRLSFFLDLCYASWKCFVYKE